MTPIPHRFLLAACALTALLVSVQSEENVGIPAQEGRRLEVLFLGSRNLFNHDPITRFRVLRKALGVKGVNFTYTDQVESLTSANLARYDVLLIFANHYTIGEDEKAALLEFARDGGGCVLLHCAAACFRESQFDEYVDLLGAQFASHETGVFRARIVDAEHPVMKDWESFECWDETYVHKRHSDDRTILQRRGDEPWTWVRTYGKGRVFYTASGHDHRCWNVPAYHDLLHRAIRWTAGDANAALVDNLRLPELQYRPAAVPENPENPVGPNNVLQLPLSPAESLKLAQIPTGFELKLFASEPLVVNPICMNWDARGRLWVVEAFDYPHKVESDAPQDGIKILEDTDSDGVADKATLFAEGLNICTSMLPMPDGAIATDGHDMVYLRDSDGDGRADEKSIIFTGLNLRDTHACTSNLRYGYDNWIYATVGYSGLKVELNGRTHESDAGVFRFRPDGSDFEILQNTTNNTWGLGFTEEGDVVGSTANGNPSWYLSIPNRYYKAAGLEAPKTPRADAQDILYPITTDYFQNWPKEQVSSGAGHALYTDARFPNGWRNRRVFVCEPPLHLVTAPIIENHGLTFKTTHFESNLYASADAWSAPVSAECGPDGAVWIADWYNPICNHNPYRKHQQRGTGNAFVTDDRDRSHGRIYRIFPGSSASSSPPQLSDPVASLSHSSQFWRLTAQKELVYGSDKPDVNTIDSLYALAGAENVPASLHALHALHGVGQANAKRFRALLRELSTSAHRSLAAVAIAMRKGNTSDAIEMLGIARDADCHSRVRQQATLFLTDLSSDATLGESLARSSLSGATKPVAEAMRLAILRHPEGFVRHLIEAATALDQPEVETVITDIGARLEHDKDFLSPGLLAFARRSDAPVAKFITGKFGAVPNHESVPVELSASAKRGKDTYLTCVACHQPDGQGIPGAFPALAGSPRATGDQKTLIQIVLKGLQGPLMSQDKSYKGIMPGHETTLDDRGIADVLSYVRSSWGNGADGVSKEKVAQVRAAVAGQTSAYTVGELAQPVGVTGHENGSQNKR